MAPPPSSAAEQMRRSPPPSFRIRFRTVVRIRWRRPSSPSQFHLCLRTAPRPRLDSRGRITWRRWLTLPPFHLWFKIAVCLSERKIRWTVSQLFCLHRAAAPSRMPCLGQGRRWLGRMETWVEWSGTIAWRCRRAVIRWSGREQGGAGGGANGSSAGEL
jgi:hypothetical protein